jgi:type IV secretory pathway VirB10-like protein
MAEPNETGTVEAEEIGPSENSPSEHEAIAARPRWRQIFRQAVEKARCDQGTTKRRELGRDHSRSLFWLVGAAIAIVLLFLGIFSSPNSDKKQAQGRRPGTPELGRKVTPGQRDPQQSGSVTPLLSADVARTESSGVQGVSADDVSKTARPIQQSAMTAKPLDKNPGSYSLARIDFPESTPQENQEKKRPPIESETSDLKKPSLVFVRSAESARGNGSSKPAAAEFEADSLITELPQGTRLVARLESAVNSAISTPVVAGIEYNYEKDGEIIVPAGTRAIGTLQQATRSGDIAIHFNTLERPDGTVQKIDAVAMSLAYGPLKGRVEGKNTGTRFLVRTFTGLGTAATYLVGAGGSNGFNGPLSESALLRDRIASNVGIAGDQELSRLAFNQNIVITVPGNTRFYLVVQKGTDRTGRRGQATSLTTTQETRNPPLPGASELRQLLQLQRELSQAYQQSDTQATTAQAPPDRPQ